MQRIAWCVMLACVHTAALPAQQERARTTPSAFPFARVAATSLLDFHSALPVRGSLQEQVRTQWRELLAKSRGGNVIKLRVFAIGDSDLQQSQSAIKRLAAEARTPLPVVSLVGVAGFPDSEQRVQLESTTASTAILNPRGVAFIAGLASPDGARAVAGLARVAGEAGVPPGNIVRISCFYEHADQVGAARTAVAERFPNAAATFVFSYARSARPAIECEAVGRLAVAPIPDVRYVNLLSGAPSANYSHAALVSAPRLLFTGSETAEGTDTTAMQALLSRVAAGVSQHGARLADVVMGDNYWLSDSARDQLRVARAKAFEGTVPAATGVFLSSLSDRQATVALELVIAVGRAHVDTIALFPGNALVDGRFFQSHLTEATQTIAKGGTIVQANHYTMDKQVTGPGEAPLLHLNMDALSNSGDPDVRADITLDLKTMALVQREDRDKDGLRSTQRVDGAHVTGEYRGAGNATRSPFDFVLPQASFSSAFLDAAANAAELRQGIVLRIPSFGVSPTQRTSEWHHFHVLGRDTVRVKGDLLPAWIIEEPAGGVFPPRRIWLLRQPPYFPLDITYLPDGSTLRVEQRLLHLRPSH